MKIDLTNFKPTIIRNIASANIAELNLHTCRNVLLLPTDAADFTVAIATPDTKRFTITATPDMLIVDEAITEDMLTDIEAAPLSITPPALANATPNIVIYVPKAIDVTATLYGELVFENLCQIGKLNLAATGSAHITARAQSAHLDLKRSAKASIVMRGGDLTGFIGNASLLRIHGHCQALNVQASCGTTYLHHNLSHEFEIKGTPSRDSKSFPKHRQPQAFQRYMKD